MNIHLKVMARLQKKEKKQQPIKDDSCDDNNKDE